MFSTSDNNVIDRDEIISKLPKYLTLGILKNEVKSDEPDNQRPHKN